MTVISQVLSQNVLYTSLFCRGGLPTDIAVSRLQARMGSPCPEVLTQPAGQLDRDAEQLCE